MDLKINYNDRMLNYYPEIIKAIREFQVLIETESLEVDQMHDELTRLLENAYIKTSDESRIAEWEKMLGITPLPQGEDSMETWLSDRRETILARLYKNETLNSNYIANIVKIFTGGECVSTFKDSTITVVIYPPKDNKSYKFENVEQELKTKVPAHLQFQVSRNYITWLEVNNGFSTWGDIKNAFDTWNDILFNIESN